MRVPRIGGARLRPALLIPVCLLAAACTGSSGDDAAASATERVRASATGTRDVVRDVVSAPDAPRGQALLDRVLERVPAGPDVITFDKRANPDGGITVRVAFHARGESGGGLSYDAVVARLCVEYTAAPGPPPVAEVRDTQCAADLPTATGNAGNVDITVTLDG